MFVFLPLIHQQAHKSPQTLYKQSKRQNLIVVCSAGVSCSLPDADGERSGGRSPEVSFSGEMSLTALALEKTVSDDLSQASHRHQSMWEEKLEGNASGLKT